MTAEDNKNQIKNDTMNTVITYSTLIHYSNTLKSSLKGNRLNKLVPNGRFYPRGSELYVQVINCQQCNLKLGASPIRCHLRVRSHGSRRCWLTSVAFGRRGLCRCGLVAANTEQIEDGLSREWARAWTRCLQRVADLNDDRIIILCTSKWHEYWSVCLTTKHSRCVHVEDCDVMQRDREHVVSNFKIR